MNYENKLGSEKARQIESDISLYSDADQFRIYHAKGRWRGTISAGVFTATLLTIMAPGRTNGYGFAKKNPLLSGAVFGGSLFVFY